MEGAFPAFLPTETRSPFSGQRTKMTVSTNLVCHGCGLAAAAEVFLSRKSGMEVGGAHGTSIPGWFCPQCSSPQPRLAFERRWSDDPVAPWPLPKWEVVATSQGLAIRAGNLTSPMCSVHQLSGAPASLLIAGESGTFADFSAKVRAEADGRARAFHSEVKAWHAENPRPRVGASEEGVAWQKALVVRQDELRQAHGVGPHFKETSWDGATLEREARISRTA